LARSLGGTLQRILLVGCEPAPFPSEDDMQMELSEPVRSAVGEAVRTIETLVADIQANGFANLELLTLHHANERSVQS
jgi:hydrogenase maturation protease